MRGKRPPADPSPILCEQCRAIAPKMTAAEVASILKIARKTVLNGGAGTDELPREYYGGSVRFDKRAFEDWLKRKANESQERLKVAFAGRPKILTRLGLNKLDDKEVIIKQRKAERETQRRKAIGSAHPRTQVK